jgi:hypothetical protein
MQEPRREPGKPPTIWRGCNKPVQLGIRSLTRAAPNDTFTQNVVDRALIVNIGGYPPSLNRKSPAPRQSEHLWI